MDNNFKNNAVYMFGRDCCKDLSGAAARTGDLDKKGEKEHHKMIQYRRILRNMQKLYGGSVK